MWSGWPLWTSPSAPLRQRQDERVTPVTPVAEVTFELFGTVLDTQRRHLDHFLLRQRQLTGHCLAALAAVARHDRGDGRSLGANEGRVLPDRFPGPGRGRGRGRA
jgi:hypothetical protein